MASHRLPRASWTSVFAILFFCVCHAIAATADSPGPVETLVLDPRVRYEENGVWVMMSQDEVARRMLQKRQDDAPKVTTTFQIAVSTVTEASTTSTVPASPLPSPLDSNLSSNFTTSEDGSIPCPKFLNAFLTDPKFKQCYPLSLLLQGSRSFFNAEKSLVSTTQVLDATCHANVTYCNGYLSELAKSLIRPENCGLDFNAANPIIRNAYIALQAYTPIYSAGCLKDPQTSMYCYANAITNLTNPSNVNIYYLALNVSLQGSAVPSCNSCLQQTMNVFQAATANRKQYLANTYVSAASQINLICGPNFVNETLAVEIASSAGFRRYDATSSAWAVISIPLVAMLTWLL